MSDTTKQSSPLEAGVSVLVFAGETPAIELPSDAATALVVGRESVDVDIVLRSNEVSRRHASIRGGTPATIEDLGSANGTKVMGRRLVPGERAPLTVGSVIEIGDVPAFVQAAMPGVFDSAPIPTRARSPRSPSPDNEDARSLTVIHDARMRELYELVEVIGPSSLSVLILGETGVGKDVYANRVHAASLRSAMPFLRLNCAAMPETLLEAELFGYERGAFTGAVQSKPGLLEVAHGGTLFLDEVGELTKATQAKLLRVLESDEVQRLGAIKPRRVDIRFVAATHQDLETLVEEGAFRMDLYFRLNGITVTLPSLRERTSDLLPLARRFLPPNVVLTSEAEAKLLEYSWPGNVRELKNVIGRAAVLARGAAAIKPEHLLLSRLKGTVRQQPQDEDPDRERIIDAMARHNGNQSRVATELGMPRTTLIRKLARLGLLGKKR